MILDRITLTDFGLFAGRQSIALTPPTPHKPVVLFGGLNGGGKTTLLDALQLCLFGPRAKIAGRGRMAYGEYLGGRIHDKSRRDEASIEIEFRHTADGKEDAYTLRRSWRRIGDRCREEFNVLRNGRVEPAVGENWASQVENLLPANIAHLFLFDGEQIERYASPADSGALVGTAIQNLLGLDIVDQLDKDIRVLERRKRTERMDDAAREKLSAAETELRELRESLHGIKQERASLRNTVERRQRELAAVEEEFRQLGGELFERREEIEAKLAQAEAAIAASADALRGLAAGPLPLRLVGDLLDAVAARDRNDLEIVQARQLQALLGERDAAALAYLDDREADPETMGLLRAYLAKNRKSVATRAAGRTVLDLGPGGRNAMSGLIHGQLDEIGRATQLEWRRHAERVQRVEDARTMHDSIPEMDGIADVMARRASVRAEGERLRAEDANLARDAERLERAIQRAERALGTIMEQDVRERERLEDRERTLQSAAKVRATLSAFRREIVRRHVSSIEHLVLESYQQLLRKTSLVTGLAIDPKGFAVTLYGEKGEVLRAEALSAGERQLLGVALLWGLAKASGRPLPTAIDSPLGRLDTGHRRHFVEQYLPFASHQTLVFSTDEEIVGDYLARLRPWIGRTYYLDYDDAAGRTRVEAGYFAGEPVGGD